MNTLPQIIGKMTRLFIKYCKSMNINKLQINFVKHNKLILSLYN